MGGLTLIMWAVRFVVFTIYESPKYLMGKGNDERAVEVIHEVARRNSKSSTLTIEDLKACEALDDGANVQTTAAAALKRNLQKVNLTHVRALFSNRRLGFSTAMIMIIWGFIGLGEYSASSKLLLYPFRERDTWQYANFRPAYPLYNAFLPYIQATRGFDFGDGSTYITYRNSLILTVLGVPGALLGGLLVEIKNFGRKGTLCVSTILTGVFLYASTTATNSNALLGWNCGFSFASNVMVCMHRQSIIFKLPMRAVLIQNASLLVRGSLHLHPRSFPDKGQRHGKRSHGDE